MSAPRVQLPNDAYTVGWISAISTEKMAALCFLDEEHEPAEFVAQHDNNVYTLGRMGKNNVVIAILPDGEYGTVAASAVAKDLVHSFPNIRVGLMVGIGGGAPSSRHDIRLGDVVVSSPGGGYGGVIQYDFGKTIQEQSFQITSMLDQPPPLLRTAISSLKSRHEYEGHDIKARIGDILSRKKRVRKAVGPPHPDTDRLFRSDHLHPRDAADCTGTCDGNDDMLIFRPPREEDDDDDPAIHYGLIASANQLMKDAVVRDRLAREKDVLCFEMEAAGLMNHFPCVVIRGICDYSDTHKNKVWQGYAAMTAAAYAKEVLSQIQPTRLEAEETVGKVLSKFRIDVLETKQTVVQTAHDITRMTLQERQKKIRHWLSPPDPSTNLNSGMKLRHPRSGEWFLYGEEYSVWKWDPKALLWLNGKPGSGKSVLGSTIVHDHETAAHRKDGQTLLYFFFDFNEKTKCSVDGLIRSLIYQAYLAFPDARDPLKSLYESCRRGETQPRLDTLYETLKGMLDKCQHVRIFIDALDECEDSDRSHQTHGLLSWLREMYDAHPTMHLLITSRPVQDIQSFIHGWAGKQVSLSLQTARVSPDIGYYIKARVREHEGLARWRQRPAIQDEIEKVLTEKADGMFRWVACQLDALEKCLNLRSLRAALNSLPQDLDETYARIVRAVPSQNWPHVKRLLQFLAYTERKVHLQDVVDALAVDLDARPRFAEADRMPIPEEVMRYCSGLVTIVPKQDWYETRREGGEVQLAHFSVKEWIVSDRLDTTLSASAAAELGEAAARTSIAKVCLAYLIDIASCLAEHDFQGNRQGAEEEVRQRWPFGWYAAWSWASHARAVEDDVDHGRDVGDMALEFFSKTSLLFLMYDLWNYGYILSGPSSEADIEEEAASTAVEALCYASREGLTCLVEQLILHGGADVNAAISSQSMSALHQASTFGHHRTAEMLLRHGAAVHYLGTIPLGRRRVEFIHLAARGSSHETVREGGRVESIHLAALGGHHETVRVLCRYGADPNEIVDDRSPLAYALERDSPETVRALVELGAVPDRELFARMWAEGSESVARALLEAGADIHDQGEGSALYHAAASGNWASVSLILELKARTGEVDVNELGKGRYGTALQASAAGCHLWSTMVLLDCGADVALQGSEYGSVLYAAVDAGRRLARNSRVDPDDGGDVLVRLLLDHGASMTTPNKEYPTVLHAALTLGIPRVASLLLERSRDATRSKFTVTEDMLCSAAANPWLGSSMVRMLLEAHAEYVYDDDDDDDDDKNKDTRSLPPVTDNVIEAAARNWPQGKAILTLLMERLGDDVVDVTEQVLLAAVVGSPLVLNEYDHRHRGPGTSEDSLTPHDVVTTLLEACRDARAVSAAVIETAIQAKSLLRKDLIRLIERAPRGHVHVSRASADALCYNWFYMPDVFPILLDKADGPPSVQHLLLVAATMGKRVMSVNLLQRVGRGDGRVAMTEDIVVAVIEDGPDSVEFLRVILDTWRGAVPVTARVLATAARHDHGPGIIEMLLESYRDEVTQPMIMSACTSAAITGHRESLEMLCSLILAPRDIDPQWADIAAVRRAAEDGDVEQMERLLQRGAPADTPDARGRTPLLAAAAEAHLGVVELLLKEADIDVHCTSADGRSVLDELIAWEMGGGVVTELPTGEGGQEGGTPGTMPNLEVADVLPPPHGVTKAESFRLALSQAYPEAEGIFWKKGPRRSFG